MGSLIPPVLDAEDVVWLRDQEELPTAARVAAASLARRIGFDEQRCAEVALAVSEAATNLRKHAVDGAFLLRTVRTPSDAGLEFVTTDEGPGMADVAYSLADGTSTSGTLGIGLGAISRLADFFDLHSLPGRGTVLTARFWTKEAARRFAAQGSPVVEGLTRAITGEDVCGDAWAARRAGVPADGGSDRRQARTLSSAAPPEDPLGWAQLTGFRRTADGSRHADGLRHTDDRLYADGSRRTDDRLYADGSRRTDDRLYTDGSRHQAPAPADVRAGSGADEPALLVLFCDGLGHGPLAGRAAQAAVAAFHGSDAQQPDAILMDVHKALRGGRGGAVAVVRIEPGDQSVYFCGVGNVSTFVVDPATGTRRSLSSAPGIVGHHLPTLRSVRQELPRDGAVIMHSDGLTERWQATALPGFLEHSPLVAAAQLLREAGVRRDDAGVVVAKGPW
ncbi:Anti-sigma regulatory factor (Ser/Thr protein kinase) [Streptomyces sp. LamerLS-316]|uniref:ATP-binding SpoIIE family protein phosphatase n=1 Tax=unclassified Streptomyces TaxID=2593676 RepID=UPI000823CECF|nr:ATP-binding SpoIIE family protein phosphatase [Streptomyces sp. LamerLS-316]MYQ40250.1 SpoIIE family protein phosphatase [Streptomyces sp. SID4921]SCK14187.1 Anti-sigma regulatory factor (Ser/Thr protein kinase) [Streptomyces sp. LamerLS-316]